MSTKNKSKIINKKEIMKEPHENTGRKKKSYKNGGKLAWSLSFHSNICFRKH
jgi:hypothetical protein